MRFLRREIQHLARPEMDLLEIAARAGAVDDD
jgi:hypothetical protein